MTTTQATVTDPTAAALDRARALARAIGESAAFRAFEAAQEALAADADLGARLPAFQGARAGAAALPVLGGAGRPSQAGGAAAGTAGRAWRTSEVSAAARYRAIASQ